MSKPFQLPESSYFGIEHYRFDEAEQRFKYAGHTPVSHRVKIGGEWIDAPIKRWPWTERYPILAWLERIAKGYADGPL